MASLGSSFIAGLTAGMGEKKKKEPTTVGTSFISGLMAADQQMIKMNEGRPRGKYTGNTQANIATASSSPDTAVYPEEEMAAKQLKNNDSILSGLNYKQYNIPTAAHGKNRKVDRLVTHRTTGHGFHPNAPRLTKKGFGAHYTILQDGSIAAVNSPDDKMWHAGPKGNTNSIGIEVTGKYLGEEKGWEKMTEAQRSTLGILGKRLIDTYGITKENIQPHYKLAAKTGTEGQSVTDLLVSSFYS